jgi:antitoxin ParD1/3/4
MITANVNLGHWRYAEVSDLGGAPVNVSLTPELEAMIQERVHSGRYTSASEVVREALRLLIDRDEVRQARLGEIRGKVAEGLRSLERGEGRDGDEVIDEILASSSTSQAS